MDVGPDVFTVEQFMRFALYHSDKGYYTANIRGFGRRGDFTTAPGLAPVLGQAVARWARKRRPGPRPFGAWNVIEVGAGDGGLAAAVCRAVPWPARIGMHYHIVETSPLLEQWQRARLRGRRFRWHSDMRAALAACGGRALVVSNELVDAFPCVQWRWESGRWREAGVRLGDGPPQEVLLDPDPSRANRWRPAALERGGPRRPGDRVEMHLAYAEWLETWVPALDEGVVLTVDYGGDDPGPRPGGTLRAYWHHQRIEGPDVFLRPGRQDITADVDFRDLRQWGETLGLQTTWLGNQREFVLQWAGRLPPTVAAQHLLDIDGAGGAFKVLEQAKAPGSPPPSDPATAVRH